MTCIAYCHRCGRSHNTVAPCPPVKSLEEQARELSEWAERTLEGLRKHEEASRKVVIFCR